MDYVVTAKAELFNIYCHALMMKNAKGLHILTDQFLVALVWLPEILT